MASSEVLIKWKVFLSRTIHLSIILFVFPCIGEYIGGIVVEFHTSLPLASWAFTLMVGLSFLVGPFVQIIYRYFSHRHVSVVASIAFGLLFITIGMFARNIVDVYVCTILSGGALGVIGLSTYIEVGEYFKSDFGMANAASYLISGALTIGGPLLIEYFKEEYGLRNTLILMGAITWHLVLAGVCLTNKKVTTHPSENSHEVQTVCTKSFLRSHPYLVCHFAFETLAFGRGIGVPLLMYPFGISKGLSNIHAAILTSMCSLGAVVGRLIAVGIFLWKVMAYPLGKANVITVTPVFVSLLGQILSLYVNSELVFNVMAITAGISTGFETSWGMSCVMDLSCNEHFEATGSWVLFFSGLGATFGGLVVGSTHDIRGSYDDVMVLVILLSIVQVIFVVVTLTWKRLAKGCYLQESSKLYKLDCYDRNSN